MITNYKKQIFEPRLPLRREGGMLDRCNNSWENLPAIQLGTRPDWWGNKISTSDVGSVYAETIDQPIQADGEFLAQREALATLALVPLEDVPGLQSYTPEATNPINDRVDMDVTVEINGQEDQLVVVVPGFDATAGGDSRDWQDINSGLGTEDIQDVNATLGVEDIQDVNA